MVDRLKIKGSRIDMEADKELFFAILFVSALFVVLAIGVGFSLTLISKQRITHQIAMKDRQLTYEKELREAQTAVSDMVMTQIGRELHDGINNTILSAKILLDQAVMEGHASAPSVQPSIDLLQGVIAEVRQLSRSLSTDVVKSRGFIRSIESELTRLRFMPHLEIESRLAFEEGSITPDQQLMLFRIFQELVSNTLKHAEASLIRVQIESSANFIFVFSDNGKGFDWEQVLQGGDANGLRNIQRRAEIAGFKHQIITAPGQGCKYEFYIQRI